MHLKLAPANFLATPPSQATASFTPQSLETRTFSQCDYDEPTAARSLSMLFSFDFTAGECVRPVSESLIGCGRSGDLLRRILTSVYLRFLTRRSLRLTSLAHHISLSSIHYRSVSTLNFCDLAATSSSHSIFINRPMRCSERARRAGCVIEVHLRRQRH